LASVRPGTGEIVAMYAGKNYLKNQLNDATQATALAGSTFKPFALTAALEDGISLYSTWDGSSPRTIQGYTLQNYGNVSFGTVTLLKATENSINTPYVELGLTVGTENVKRAAIRAGVPKDTTGLLADPTTVLGTASPTALDMAHAYSTFAARGERADLSLITQVKTPDKQVDYELVPETKQEFDVDVMDNVNFALAAGRQRRYRDHGTGSGSALGGQDRHHGQQHVRLVCRLHPAVGYGGDDGQVRRERQHGHPGGDRRHVQRHRWFVPGADLDGVQPRRPRGPAGRDLPDAGYLGRIGQHRPVADRLEQPFAVTFGGGSALR
jgi:hypothetical protein